MDYGHLITVEPGKRSGKPCIRGMRITVYDVLEYLASGMTEEEILADFSELTREDITACLAFAGEPSEIPVVDWQRQELERRYQDYVQNPSEGSSWSEVREHLLSGLR